MSEHIFLINIFLINKFLIHLMGCNGVGELVLNQVGGAFINMICVWCLGAGPVFPPGSALNTAQRSENKCEMFDVQTSVQDQPCS